jgi:hypothetical protein
MADPRSVSWKEIFEQALNETDREKLRRLVREAEVAILLRREELGGSSTNGEELSTMAVATEALRSIRANELGESKPGASNRGEQTADTA